MMRPLSDRGVLPGEPVGLILAMLPETGAVSPRTVPVSPEAPSRELRENRVTPAVVKLYGRESRPHSTLRPLPGNKFITSRVIANRGGSHRGGRENCRHRVQRRRTGRSTRATEAIRPDLHGSASRRSRNGEDGRRAYRWTAAGGGEWPGGAGM